MSSALKRSRRFIDARNDWQYQREVAPVNTSGNQFIEGQKSFRQVITAFDNINCHGKYLGDGSLLTNVLGTDVTKLPLAGGTMTGSLTLTAPAKFIGDGSALTGVIATDDTKVLKVGDTMTGSLTLTAPAKFIGDGSLLTNVISTDNTKVLKAGDTMTGSLTLTAPAKFIGDGSLLTNVISTDVTKLPLAGGTMTGNIAFNSASCTILNSTASAIMTLGTGLGSFVMNGTSIQYAQPLVPTASALPSSTTQIGGSATVTGSSLSRSSSGTALSFANVTLTPGVWNIRGHLRIQSAGGNDFDLTKWGNWFNTSVAAPTVAPYNTTTEGEFNISNNPRYSQNTGEKLNSVSFILSLAISTTIYQCAFIQFGGGGTVNAYMSLTYTRVA